MDKDGNKIGVALSGGGYRAAAYHIGTLRALHKLSILEKVDVISSVSGGSITAAYYVQNKSKEYEDFEKEFKEKLKHNILWLGVIDLLFVLALLGTMVCLIPNPYRAYSWIPILVLVLVCWYYLFPFSKCIEVAYCCQFFKGAKLNEINKIPVLAINTTDLSTGNQFTFSQEKITCYPYKDHLTFSPEGFPLARAVMASSCIPQLFSPVKIGKKFYSGTFEKRPLLVDGGLYDNQGAHKLGSYDSYFSVDYAIVSDAGNTVISSKGCINPIMTLIVSVDIMMRRIKTFQRQHNSYISEDKKKVIYAYNDLMWNEYDEFVTRFVNNIKSGYIPKKVTDSHGISDELIRDMRNPQTSQEAFEEVKALIEKNIGWGELIQRKPTHHDIAIKVGTNLTGLSNDIINALIEHSAWMTEVQVKLHLPFLIQTECNQMQPR